MNEKTLHGAHFNSALCGCHAIKNFYHLSCSPESLFVRLVIQRVSEACVRIENLPDAAIQKGLLVLVGFEKDDTEIKIPKAAEKLVKLRLFEDADGKMNRSIADAGGSFLIVPNFTLASRLDSGNRPSFENALSPEKARIFFDLFLEAVKKLSPPVKSGVFGTTMFVSLTNDGPITFILEI